MGIIRLGQFLKKSYPHLLRPRYTEYYRGKTFAIDASSTIYSFLAKTITYSRNSVNIPTDSQGNMTGHLIGLLYRALLVKQLDIDAVWVFDGKPPRQKMDQLYRRKILKEQAAEKAEGALEDDDAREAAKQNRRTIYVKEEQRSDAKELLELMGMPVIQAKSEAEAQCAWLMKNKMVEGVIGEDTDTLVFGGQTLVKNFNRKEQAIQMTLSSILEELGLSYEQYIDFCILCGCDYTSKVPGIGPVKALKMIKSQKNIENVIEYINSDNKLRIKHRIPDDFNYLIARRLFMKPEVVAVRQQDLQQKEFREAELKNFLLSKDFDEDRIDNWIYLARQFEEKNRE